MEKVQKVRFSDVLRDLGPNIRALISDRIFLSATKFKMALRTVQSLLRRSLRRPEREAEH